MAIQATASGSGDGNNGRGSVPFSPLLENQRSALLFTGGNVYIAYGSHGNTPPFHGWLLAYNGTSLAQTSAYNATPNGSGGGIWAGGASPAADTSGNIFVATGSGTFDASITGAPFNNDFGESVLRLTASPGVAIANFFTPFNEIAMNSNPSTDLGSSGMLLLPTAAGSTAHANLAILGSQTGTLYLLDRGNLGAYTPGGPDKVVQELTLPGAFYGTPAFWRRYKARRRIRFTRRSAGIG